MAAVSQQIAEALAALAVAYGEYPAVVADQADEQDGDPDPLVTVAVTRDGSKPAAFGFDFVTYSAALALVTRSGGAVAGAEDQRRWKEDVRRAALEPGALAGVEHLLGVEQADSEPAPAGGLKANRRYTAVRLTVRTCEPRGD